MFWVTCNSVAASVRLLPCASRAASLASAGVRPYRLCSTSAGASDWASGSVMKIMAAACW